MRTMKLPEQAERLIAAARASCNKGNYPIYSMYKERMEKIDMTPCEYQQALRRLADALNV